MELAESYPSCLAETEGLTRVVNLLKTYELQVSLTHFPVEYTQCLARFLY